MPATDAPPRNFQLGDYVFSVLNPDCADEDFAAVTASAAHLDGFFGNTWPRGLTWEKNRSDLERHAREFDQKIAFAWVIRNAAGGYLGCAYLRPAETPDADGGVYLWLRLGETGAERLAGLAGLLRDWLAGLGYDPARHPIATR
jgi:hypothetical protein